MKRACNVSYINQTWPPHEVVSWADGSLETTRETVHWAAGYFSAACNSSVMEPLALPGNGPSTSNEPVVPAEHRLEAEAEACINLKFHFSDSEREILRDYFYHQSVTSVTKKNVLVISRIAAEVGCTEKQVKVSMEVLSAPFLNGVGCSRSYICTIRSPAFLHLWYFFNDPVQTDTPF